MMITCSNCKSPYEGSRYPSCPLCLSKQWESTPDFIRPKHDPAYLPSGSKKFRSVLTPDFVANKNEFLEYAAASGEWFYSVEDKKFCHFTPTPLSQIPGSGQLKFELQPSFAMSGLLIADASAKAHAFAEDITKFQQQVSAGDYQKIPMCSSLGCDNLCVPGKTKCLIHL
jgi:hypothetical protein